MNNREKLMTLMVDYELDRRDVAELVRVKREIVDRWLVSHESKHHEDVPDMAIELLEMNLKARAES
jgi:hypothetical protein